MKRSFFLSIGFWGVFLLASSVAPVVSADDTVLPLGSRVDTKALQKLFSSTDIEHFIQNIQSKKLKVIAVNRKRNPLAATTIPEKYWDKAGGYTRYFNKVNKDSPNGSGLFIYAGAYPWNRNHGVIFICKDVPMQILFHEYLHYLISSNPHNKVSIALDGKKGVKRMILHAYIIRLQKELKVAEKIYNKDRKNNRKRLTFSRTYIKLSTAHFIFKMHLVQEELEILRFLLNYKERLRFTKSTKLQIYFAMKDQVKVLNEYVSQFEKEHGILKDGFHYNRSFEETLVSVEEMNHLRARMNSFASELQHYKRLAKKYDSYIAARSAQYVVYEGDITMDGRIDEKDKAILLQVLDKVAKKLDHVTLQLCDVNDDDKVDGNDVVALNRLIRSDSD